MADVKAYVTNEEAFIATCTGNFTMIDLSSYVSYLGIKKTGVTDYEDEFHGFVWTLIIYQKEYNAPAF